MGSGAFAAPWSWREAAAMTQSDLDAALFFDAVPGAYALYRAFADAVAERWPDAGCRVQKTQITFTNPRVFACASLLRAKRKAELPTPWITVTLGLPHRLTSPGWPPPWSPVPAAGPPISSSATRTRSTESSWTGWPKPMPSPPGSGDAAEDRPPSQSKPFRCGQVSPGEAFSRYLEPKCRRRKARISLSKAMPSPGEGTPPSGVTMHRGGNRTHHQLWPAPAPRTICRAS